jgi:integrase
MNKIYYKRVQSSMVVMKDILNIPITNLNKKLFDTYVAKRLKTVKPSTVKADYIILNSALNYAVSRSIDGIELNPISGYWRNIKMDHKVNEVPMPDKLQALINALDCDTRKAIWFCLATGCRFNEMATLQASDITNGVIYFHHCKFGYIRYFNLGVFPFDIPTSGNVFLNGKRTWKNNALLVKLRAACVKIGIGKQTDIRSYEDTLTVHDMRRAHATYRLANGATQFDLQTQCGWKSTSMVDRYAQAKQRYANTPDWLPKFTP